MRIEYRSLAVLGLTLLAAGWAHADTVTFDFSATGLPVEATSITVAGSNPSYSATAIGKTYADTISDTISTSGDALFNSTPAYGSGNAVQVVQYLDGVGVDSGGEPGTSDRRINSYGIPNGSIAEVLWVAITPQTGYTITSATLINVENGEVGGLLDAAGNKLVPTRSADGLNLTFAPPLNSYIFGLYESNRGSMASQPRIKLSQFQITLSPAAVPLPNAALAGFALMGVMSVTHVRRRKHC